MKLQYSCTITCSLLEVVTDAWYLVSFYRYRECQKLKYAHKPSKKCHPPQLGPSVTLLAPTGKRSKQEAESEASSAIQQKQSIGNDPESSVSDSKDPDERTLDSSVLEISVPESSVPYGSVLVKEGNCTKGKGPECKIPEDRCPESKEREDKGP